jgi:hypothetical protein
MVYKGPGLAAGIKRGMAHALRTRGQTLASLRGSRMTEIAAGRF